MLPDAVTLPLMFPDTILPGISRTAKIDSRRETHSFDGRECELACLRLSPRLVILQVAWYFPNVMEFAGELGGKCDACADKALR